MCFRLLLAVALTLGFVAYAQVSQQPPPDQQPSSSQPVAEPAAPPPSASTAQTQPSPAASSIPTEAAPAEVAPASDQTDSSDYTGPGILTRGYTVSRLADRSLRFRPYLRFAGMSDDGLTSMSSSNGELEPVQSLGVEGGFGISGRKIFKNDIFELEFRGNVFHYGSNSAFDGTNFILDLNYQHSFTPHILLALQEHVGQYSTNYPLLNSAADPSVGSTAVLVTPNTQLFDSRVFYASSAVDLQIAKSPRLSFDFGGSGFLTRQSSDQLYGLVGSQARVDVTYRLTRRTSVGAYYSYTNYIFTDQFGGSNINTLGLIFSHSISRTLEFRSRIGGSRAETRGIQVITLDPVIAAILGTPTGAVAIYARNYLADVSAQLSKQMKRGGASISYAHGVSPGNGLYLTSKRDTIGAYYDYTGIKRYTFSAGATRDSLSSLGLGLGKYTSFIVSGGVARVLGKGFQADLHADYRHYDVSGAPFLQNAYRVSVGVEWTPSEKPLNIW